MLVAAPLGDSLRKFGEIALESGGAFLGTSLDLAHLHRRNSISNRRGGENNHWRSRLFRNKKCQARHSVSLFRAGWHQQRKRSEQGIMPCILLNHSVVSPHIIDRVDHERAGHSTMSNREQRVRHY